MRALVTSLLVVAAVGGGCESEPSPSPPSRPSDQRAGDLWERTFTSTKVTPRQLLPDTRIEITFEKREDYGVLRWQAGCNTIGADVEITADQLLLVGRPLGTAMGCSGSFHAQDRRLTRFFESDPRWQLSNDQLSLASGETAIELAPERAVGPIAPEDVERGNREAIGRGFVRAIGLYAPGGDTTGPRYGSVRDAFILRPALKPGRYRAIKSVGRSLRAGDGQSVRLDADFAIDFPHK